MVNFNLPDLNNIKEDDSKAISQLKNYIFQLTEQLKFYMNNIDSDNLNSEYRESVKRAIDAANSVDTISEVLEKEKGVTNRLLREQMENLICFNDLISNSLGLFSTTVTLADGSKKYYMHDASTLETSNTIYTLNAGGYAWTKSGWNNGNPQWQYGTNVDGNAVYNALSVYKLTADLISAGTLKLGGGSNPTQLQIFNSSNVKIGEITNNGVMFEFSDDNGKFRISIGLTGFDVEYYNDEGLWDTIISAGANVNSHTGVRYLDVGTIRPCCINDRNDNSHWDLSTGDMYIKGYPVGLQSYPIGSIYISVNYISPASLFGGTWEQVQGRFLLGAGGVTDIAGNTGTYQAGTVGGEIMHALDSSELPYWTFHASTYGTTGGYTVPAGTNSNASPAAYLSGQTWTGKHNNIPPYLAVYMWKRVS